jgi:hypothetical protein
MWCKERKLDTNGKCEDPSKSKEFAWSAISTSQICNETETNEVNVSESTTVKNAEESTTERNPGELTTERSTEESTTERNPGELTTDRSTKESTTERNAEESTRSEWNSGISVAVVAPSATVTVLLLGVVVVTSAYCWRKYKYQDKLTEDYYYYDNVEQCSENTARLSLPPDLPKRPSLNETSSKDQLQKSGESESYQYVECGPAQSSTLATTEKYSCSGKSSINSEESAENTTEQVDGEIYHRNSLYIQHQS